MTDSRGYPKLRQMKPLIISDIRKIPAIFVGTWQRPNRLDFWYSNPTNNTANLCHFHFWSIFFENLETLPKRFSDDFSQTEFWTIFVIAKLPPISVNFTSGEITVKN